MVRVKVNQGVLDGESVHNPYGGLYYSFKGIPYAQPPIGDLRFQAPQEPKCWPGVRSAKEFGPVSCQFDVFTQSIPDNSSEDCLYLNVYTPNLNPVQPLPVMFWIHGGVLMWGSGNDDLYGPEFLVRKDVILVTHNYRLGALGFLCLHTKDVPGNAGMKDQVAALRWVRDNIQYFGGNPHNITIFGESAGAACVTYHLVSPMSKGIFRRAIVQSGASTCWWTEGHEPRERALALARKLGTYTEDDDQLFDFFKHQPVESFLNVQIPITLSDFAKDPHELAFNVVSETQFEGNEMFFQGDVIEYLHKKINDVEVIIGYTEDEGLIILSAVKDYEKLVEQANDFYEFFVSKPLALNCNISDQLKIGKLTRKHYCGDKHLVMADLHKIAKYYSASYFTYGIIQWAKMVSENKTNKVFFYNFTCKSERNQIRDLLGLRGIIEEDNVTCHMDDLSCIFTTKIVNKHVCENPSVLKMIDNVTTLWTNFAKNGNPTTDRDLGVTWSQYSPNKQNYMNIGETLTTDLGLDTEEINFWEDIYKRFYPHFVYKKKHVSSNRLRGECYVPIFLF